MEIQKEENLINKAKQGDFFAFEELVLRHEKKVYHLALRMMNHTEDALDISQEVFLKAYKSIEHFDAKSAFSTWLYRITYNTCVDEIRKRKGKQTFSLEEELEQEDGSIQRQVSDFRETPEQHLLRKEQKSEILQALDALSQEHKAVIIFRDIQGLSYEEIADVLEISIGTVKSRISRARNHCKEEFLRIVERKDGNSRHNKRREGKS